MPAVRPRPPPLRRAFLRSAAPPPDDDAADLLSRDALAAHAEASWPGETDAVVRAARIELLRRRDAARRFDVSVKVRPRFGLGRYVVVADGEEADALLLSLAPVRGLCGCRDFATSSLGLCAHLCAAIDAAAGVSPRRSTPLPAPTARRDPARVALLAARRAEAAAAAARVVDDDAVSRALGGLRRALYPYQRAAVVRLLRDGRLLLADDMGLGKTTQAAAAAHALCRLGRARRGVVVVPASLKAQWAQEWRDTTDVPLHAVEGGYLARRAAYAACTSGFVLVHYEQVLRDADALLALAPQLVVLDEAQRIKNRDTKTAAAVRRLACAAYRLAMTGTPIENRLDELAAILAFVDDGALAPAWRVGPEHVVRDESGRAIGLRGLAALRARLAPVVLRRRRVDVVAALPPRRDHRIDVAMTRSQRERHDEHEAPIARILHAAKKRPLRRQDFVRLMQHLTKQRVACDGAALYDYAARWPAVQRRRPSAATVAALDAPKLVELRGLLQRLVVEEGRKVVVFSQWRRMLALAEWATRDVLAGAGVRAAFFSGDEERERRGQNVVALHEDEALRVLFSTDAGGVGLNLQRASNAVVCLDLPWNPAVLEQRVARVHRPGQTKPVDVFLLVSQSGIEAKIATIVDVKSALSAGVLDDDRDQVQFDVAAGFLEQLERIRAAPVPDAPVAAPAMVTPQGDVARLVAGLRVERRDDGAVALVVGADVAPLLAALVRGIGARFDGC